MTDEYLTPDNAIPWLDVARAFEGEWSARDEPILDAIRDAEIVVGVHTATPPRGELYYGRALLERIDSRAAIYADGGRPTRVYRVALDLDSDYQRHVLAAVCAVIKGSHDLPVDDD